MAGILDDLLNSPTALNDLGTSLQAGGQIMGAVSHYQFGQQAQAAADFQAAQLRANANTELASSQRTAYEVDRRAKYIASEALARAAGSGGGASDPTVVNIIAQTKAEGAYRQAVALYQGQDRARLLELQAQAKEFEGATTKARSGAAGNAQMLGAGTTLLKGFAKDASIFQRFAGGGPQTSGSGSTPSAWADDEY